MGSPEVWVAGLVGLAATGEDLWRRQISNWIPVAALIGGIACQVLNRGWMGIPLALGGAVCGFLVFLIFYALGGMGAGDIKLMAGFGAVLGFSRILEAALWTAAVGGVIAAVVVLVAAARDWLRKRPREASPEEKYIPYAPAITMGVWLALVPK